MTLQTAIEKALKEKWNPHFTIQGWELKEYDGETAFFVVMLGSIERTHYSQSIHEILLDIEFWKALGKSMGWGEKSWCCKKEATRYALDTMPVTYQDRCKCCGRDCGIDGQEWNSYWHDFIDHLAEGNSIESYFESLG